jgi:hypothetical protein
MGNNMTPPGEGLAPIISLVHVILFIVFSVAHLRIGYKILEKEREE